MALSKSNRMSSRRTISWKAIFVVFMMTLFAWGQQFIALPRGGNQVVADEVVESNGSQTAGQPVDSVDVDTEHSDGEHNGAVRGDSEHSGGHADPVAEVLLAILIILFLAKIAGDVCGRLGMPAVLGELIVGIILGNWAMFTGSHAFDFFKPVPTPYEITGDVVATWDDSLKPTQDELWTAFETITEEPELGVGARIEVRAKDGVAGMVWQWHREQDGTDVWQLQNPNTPPPSRTGSYAYTYFQANITQHLREQPA